jgi:hypothetical protein
VITATAQRAKCWLGTIAVEGDLMADISNLERVKFVMKGGQVIKDNITPSARPAH